MGGPGLTNGESVARRGLARGEGGERGSHACMLLRSQQERQLSQTQGCRQWTHACVKRCVLPEAVGLQVIHQAQVRHAGDENTDQQHDKVSECTQ